MPKDPKRVKAGRRSKRKGKIAELGWAKKLDVILPFGKPWYRNLGTQGSQPEGDLLPSSGSREYYVECKAYDKVLFSSIATWWNDAKEYAAKQRRPLVALCIKPTGGPWLMLTNVSSPDLIRRCNEAGVLLVSNFKGVCF